MKQTWVHHVLQQGFWRHLLHVLLVSSIIIFYIMALRAIFRQDNLPLPWLFAYILLFLGECLPYILAISCFLWVRELHLNRELSLLAMCGWREKKTIMAITTSLLLLSLVMWVLRLQLKPTLKYQLRTRLPLVEAQDQALVPVVNRDSLSLWTRHTSGGKSSLHFLQNKSGQLLAVQAKHPTPIGGQIQFGQGVLLHSKQKLHLDFESGSFLVDAEAKRTGEMGLVALAKKTEGTLVISQSLAVIFSIWPLSLLGLGLGFQYKDRLQTGLTWIFVLCFFIHLPLRLGLERLSPAMDVPSLLLPWLPNVILLFTAAFLFKGLQRT